MFEYVMIAGILATQAKPVSAVEIEKELRARVRYQVVEVKEAGTIEGRVVWRGSLPEPLFQAVQMDQKVCGEKHEIKRLIVDPETKGVAESVVFIRKISKGKPLKTLGDKFVLDQKGCDYVPHVLVVPRGAKLEITSSDNVLHNVHAFGVASFNLAIPRPGIVIPQRLRRPGIATLRCDSGHTWMSGYIFVVNHPYFAVTKADGTFRLEGVPPGEYELVLWHAGWKPKGPVIPGQHPEFHAPVVKLQPVKVQAGQKTSVEFQLSAEDQP